MNVLSVTSPTDYDEDMNLWLFEVLITGVGQNNEGEQGVFICDQDIRWRFSAEININTYGRDYSNWSAGVSTPIPTSGGEYGNILSLRAFTFLTVY